jgi:hypothetical protein
VKESCLIYSSVIVLFLLGVSDCSEYYISNLGGGGGGGRGVYAARLYDYKLGMRLAQMVENQTSFVQLLFW